jgi:hypothetical protein
MSPTGQKCPKRLRLPAGKNTHEHMDRIVPKADSWHTVVARLTGRPEHEQPAVVYKADQGRITGLPIEWRGAISSGYLVKSSFYSFFVETRDERLVWPMSYKSS